MLGLNSISVTHRQNCFAGAFPKESVTLREVTSNYFHYFHRDENSAEITRIFKALVEQNGKDVNALAVDDKEKRAIVNLYKAERLVDLRQSKECSTVCKSIFEKGKADGYTREVVETAIGECMEFEVNYYSFTFNESLRHTIFEMRTKKPESELPIYQQKINSFLCRLGIRI